MLLASVILLLLFFIVDSFYYRKEKDKQQLPEKAREKVPIKTEGLYNLIFLAGLVGSVLMSGYWKAGHFNVLGVEWHFQNISRDVIIITMGLLFLFFTPTRLREANEFSWFPIQEVAKLFAGIFITIIPALAILKAGNEGALAGLVAVVKDSFHYFWVAGALSSFLDNAPTYLTFFNLALGKLGITEAMVPGALGANTYIGNAPNFMVKSIAEEAGINMPSFFGYMLKYSIPILIPIFILVTFVFFR
jgi:Na+/H+ antiporter NhaD/arsenite permease-like protein